MQQKTHWNEPELVEQVSQIELLLESDRSLSDSDERFLKGRKSAFEWAVVAHESDDMGLTEDALDERIRRASEPLGHLTGGPRKHYLQGALTAYEEMRDLDGPPAAR